MVLNTRPLVRESSSLTTWPLFPALPNIYLQTKEGLKLSAELVLFADKASNAARKEMKGNFISSFDEKVGNSI